MIRILVGLWLLLSLSACATLQDEKDEARGWSAQKLENEANLALKKGEYEKAIRYYEVLESRYPLGRIAQQAQLNMLYAYYQNDEPESALLAADRFIKLYPRHPYIDYAYYMKGVISFNQNFGPVERFFPIDLTERDQVGAKRAFKAFGELVERFPNSPYSQDAIQRMQYLRNGLANYELNVADYYMRRGAYVAAANRAQYTLEHYDGAPAVPQALVILVEAYQAMQLADLARDALRVLKLSYPQHPDISALEQTLGSPEKG